MTNERWEQLMKDDSLLLTTEESDEGWHFCPDWDGLLVGPGTAMELTCCMCEGIDPGIKEAAQWRMNVDSGFYDL